MESPLLLCQSLFSCFLDHKETKPAYMLTEAGVFHCRFIALRSVQSYSVYLLWTVARLLVVAMLLTLSL